jgi:ubiquinone biosynthesis accessory factor UbiJ
VLSIPLTLLLKPIEQQLNRAIAAHSAKKNTLAALNGHVFAIELTGLFQTLYLSVDNNELQLSLHCEREVDTKLRAAPFTLLHYAQQKDIPIGRETDLYIEGNVAALQKLMLIFKQLDFDGEEFCAQWFGDTVARRLGYLWREVARYQQARWQEGERAIADLLQEETKTLPADAEMLAFFEDVDLLRDDVARLERRIHHLSYTLMKK